MIEPLPQNRKLAIIPGERQVSACRYNCVLARMAECNLQHERIATDRWADAQWHSIWVRYEGRTGFQPVESHSMTGWKPVLLSN